jgi:hypothetical protein
VPGKVDENARTAVRRGRPRSLDDRGRGIGLAFLRGTQPRSAAAINGDRVPAWITAVVTTRAKALTSATPGDSIPGSADIQVFLITMRGNFTVSNVSRPPGAKALAGQYLSLVIDAATFQDLDFGISPAPRLSRPAAAAVPAAVSGRRNAIHIAPIGPICAPQPLLTSHTYAMTARL